MAILPRVKRENAFAQGRSSASCQQIIGRNREMSDTFARSVMDRVGDRSGRAYAHDFTNPLRTNRITSRRVMSVSPADMCTPQLNSPILVTA
jgi:hypothetical protein